MDFATTWDPINERGDWSIAAGDVVMDAGLATAVTLSLGTDRLAAADDVIPDGTSNRRGWWGDMPVDPAIASGRQHLLGSRLWLLRRAKASVATQRAAEAYIREALAWMITDGVAGEIDVQTQLAGTPPDRIYARIRIIKRGTAAAAPAFETLWSATLAG